VRICSVIENDIFGVRKLKWLKLTDEVGKFISLASGVKFSQDFTHQKSLKSVNF